MKKAQLICTSANVGRGANDGVYPPGGLLTIAKAIEQKLPDTQVVIDDQHHKEIQIRSDADLIGIQVASTLCYRNALDLARQAKDAGKAVVLGGPHVSSLYKQIAHNRPWIDFLIRGKGERPMVELIKTLGGKNFSHIPSLVWQTEGKVITNPLDTAGWQYDDYIPLPLYLLASGMEPYWQAFRHRINTTIDYSFLLFTHFGCGYRQLRIGGTKGKMSFCSYCSLDDPPLRRDPCLILSEIRHYLDRFELPKGSRIHLKCYGDNIGPQIPLVSALATAIQNCPWWNDFQISWTFYCQSSYLNGKLAKDLKAIGCSHLYIGFDGANDHVQRLNGLGTSLKSHHNAVDLCLKYGIKIQAGSVVGLAGETPKSLEELYCFFQDIKATGVLERINSAILFIIPGTPAYEMLTGKEPQIQELDLLPTEEIRGLWLKHFAPAVTPELVQEYAVRIDALSPGPHASMGYQK